MAFYRVLYGMGAEGACANHKDGALVICEDQSKLMSRAGVHLATFPFPNAVSKLWPAQKLTLGNVHITVVCVADEDSITSGAVFAEQAETLLCKEVPGPDQADPNASKSFALGSVGAYSTTSNDCNMHANHTALQTASNTVDNIDFVINAAAVATNTEKPVVLEAELAQRLRPHQREGITFLYDAVSQNRGCILADTMGLGKTLQAIGLIWALLKHGLPGGVVRKIVVVCPCSLCGNWRAEIRKWLGDQRLKPLTLSSTVGREKIETQIRAFKHYSVHRVLIISYDQLRRHALFLDNACDLLICDEGHRLRSHDASTTKQLDALQCQRRVILSGTPLQNNLEELFHCCRFVRADLFQDANTFQRLIANPLVRSREPEATAEEREMGQRANRHLEALMKQFTLRRTAEVLEGTLPPRTELVLRLRMAPPQVHAYRAVLAELQLDKKSGGHDMALALKTMLALRLLCNDARDVIASAHQAAERNRSALGTSSTQAQGAMETQVGDESGSGDEATTWDAQKVLPDTGFWKACANDVTEAAQLGASTKSAVLVSLLLRLKQDAPGDRVVVVSNFSRTLSRIQKLLHSKGLRTLILCGSTPSAKRMQIVNEFNMPARPGVASAVDVLLLSCKAGGVGLNLIGANRLVLYDPDWNPANDIQAMARIWREGQTKSVFIYRFILGGTVEEKICQRQHAKVDLFAISVDNIAGRAGINVPRLSWEELRRVFQLEGYDAAGLPTSLGQPMPEFGETVASDDARMADALLLDEELWGAILTAHIAPNAQTRLKQEPKAPHSLEATSEENISENKRSQMSSTVLENAATARSWNASSYIWGNATPHGKLSRAQIASEHPGFPRSPQNEEKGHRRQRSQNRSQNRSRSPPTMSSRDPRVEAMPKESNSIQSEKKMQGLRKCSPSPMVQSFSRSSSVDEGEQLSATNHATTTNFLWENACYLR